MQRRTTVLFTAMALAAFATPGQAQHVGPSSSQTPYVEPTAPGWHSVALLTVGDEDKKNGYAMVGIPDGLGAVAGRFERDRYVATNSYMTVFMNHEIGPNTDEESSGILEVTDLVKSASWYDRGRRYFIGDMQAHYPIPGALVQGGQLYLLISPKEWRGSPAWDRDNDRNDDDDEDEADDRD